ncbi:NADH-quinone oxidoreductase subunit NuoG [Thorsellia anophelis]|uniref:NADH-quinone oxidoreductase n=1 Tax=Thorsellia anophelis DSM 18579 TaxID=1123402 RepID=A0A1I0AEZ8_9GAMM|nr:NADH-quinone oxidoreductase subunit NuoG [Thorsellia anophelis]SES91775.1 NADH-quinone oxidoreductase subunit G [Thorsellia anophelis DSM 18579]
MATIHVDGKEYEVNGSDNLLQACLSLGLDIPYFCWHPALGSVGACRQCAVKQYANPEDTRGRLVMSCMTPAADNTFISIDDNEAKVFRESIVEWLMTNHPHDCPVCEEGGNCHLQDMTVMTGHSFRRYRFTKRTHQNQELGPFISHEMNRCIACYRCVRYYKDYADGTDFGVYGAHDNVYFGRPESGTLENEFSGNLVEVCPTGVFTDKTHSERYNRKWDMQFAPSICQQCSVGCNISPGERYGELRRIENRYNGSVNHYFLCDRGRFGYGYVNLANRPKHPVQKRGQDAITLTQPAQAIEGTVDLLRNAKRVIAIGSSRASIESNFALQSLVGKENFFAGVNRLELSQLTSINNILNSSAIHTPSLKEIESYDAVLILGEDITQSAARISLAVRQAVKGKAKAMAAAQRVADWQIAAIQNIGQRAKYPLFITSTHQTRLDDIAALHINTDVNSQASIGFEIAHAIENNAPKANSPDLIADHKQEIDLIVQALMGAKKPLIITGTTPQNSALIEAAANIAKALKTKEIEVGITFVASDVNSMAMPILTQNSLDDALSEIAQEKADVLIVLENDIYRHALKSTVDAAFSKLARLVVIDHQHTELMDKAKIILPAASFAESDGTVINQEFRMQRFFQVYDPTHYDKSVMMHESWRWIAAITSAYKGEETCYSTLDAVIKACEAAYPALKGLSSVAPDANFRVEGQKLARSPHRYSGRTSMLSNISVHEPRQPQDIDTPFAFSMEGNNQPSAERKDIPFAWAPGWNSPQAWNKFQAEVGGDLKFGNPGTRLIEAGEDNLAYFQSTSIRKQSEDKLSIVSIPHLFGTDELSSKSPVVQSRMTKPYVKMHHSVAAKYNITEGDAVELVIGQEAYRLIATIDESFCLNAIGLPLGFKHLSLALGQETVTTINVSTPKATMQHEETL